MKTRLMSFISDTSDIYATSIIIFITPEMTVNQAECSDAAFGPRIKVPRKVGNHINRTSASANPSTVPIDITAAVVAPVPFFSSFKGSSFATSSFASVTSSFSSGFSSDISKVLSAIGSSEVSEAFSSTDSSAFSSEGVASLRFFSAFARFLASFSRAASSSSSSSPESSAERVRHFIPVFMESTKLKIPRTKGHLVIAGRLGATVSHSSMTISPSGLRTAMEVRFGPRIMMPSRSAWPPIEVFIPLFFSLSFKKLSPFCPFKGLIVN